MTRLKLSSFATAVLIAVAWSPVTLAGGTCPAPFEAFNLGGEVTTGTGVLITLVPVTTPISGPVTICNPGAGGTAGVSDISTIDVVVGPTPSGGAGFCFSLGGDCGGVGAPVPITSIDSASIQFDSTAFPEPGLPASSFNVTSFSPSFNVSIPIAFDLTNGTFSADGGALGTLAGDVVFVRPPDPPIIEVTGNPVVFGPTLVNTTATMDVTVTNAGTDIVNGTALMIGSVGGIDALAPPYSISDDGCSNQMVAPQTSCVIQVQFAPTTTTVGGDSFDIPALNDLVTPSVTVNVSGSVTAPALILDPATLAFASTEVGQTRTRTVTIQSTGSAPLTIGTIDPASLNAPYTLEPNENCSGMTLPIDSGGGPGTCTLDITFAPVSAAEFMTSLNIPSDAFGSALTPLPISGTGVIGTVAQITVEPTALTFAELLVGGTPLTDTITVTSAGNEALEIFAISLSGDDAADFSQTGDCGGSLDPELTCTITVTFDPQTGGSGKSATLTIFSSADLQGELEIDITASAFSGARIVVEPTSIDLGSTSAPIDIGATTTADVMISNTGNEPLIIDQAITFAGEGQDEFAVDSEACTAMAVDPGSNCMLTVSFSPQTEADKTVTMTIPSNDAAGNASVDVAANGFVFRGPRIAVPEQTIAVGGGSSVFVDETASTTVTLNSTGTDPLTISSITLGGDNPDQFSFTDTCTAAPVETGSSCTIAVTFAPTSAGTKNAQLSISSNDVTVFASTTRGAAAPAIVNLTGTAAVRPPAPPPPRTDPPSFALADEGATGATGLWLLLAGFGLLAMRRRLA